MAASKKVLVSVCVYLGSLLQFNESKHSLCACCTTLVILQFLSVMSFRFPGQLTLMVEGRDLLLLKVPG